MQLKSTTALAAIVVPLGLMATPIHSKGKARPNDTLSSSPRHPFSLPDRGPTTPAIPTATKSFETSFGTFSAVNSLSTGTYTPDSAASLVTSISSSSRIITPTTTTWVAENQATGTVSALASTTHEIETSASWLDSSPSNATTVASLLSQDAFLSPTATASAPETSSTTTSISFVASSPTVSSASETTPEITEPAAFTASTPLESTTAGIIGAAFLSSPDSPTVPSATISCTSFAGDVEPVPRTMDTSETISATPVYSKGVGYSKDAGNDSSANTTKSSSVKQTLPTAVAQNNEISGGGKGKCSGEGKLTTPGAYDRFDGGNSVRGSNVIDGARRTLSLPNLYESGDGSNAFCWTLMLSVGVLLF